MQFTLPVVTVENPGYFPDPNLSPTCSTTDSGRSVIQTAVYLSKLGVTVMGWGQGKAGPQIGMSSTTFFPLRLLTRVDQKAHEGVSS